MQNTNGTPLNFLECTNVSDSTIDAKVFALAAEKVEQRHPALVGGIGIYKACCGHGPFTHIDTRGYRARWYGEGAG